MNLHAENIRAEGFVPSTDITEWINDVNEAEDREAALQAGHVLDVYGLSVTFDQRFPLNKTGLLRRRSHSEPVSLELVEGYPHRLEVASVDYLRMSERVSALEIAADIDFTSVSRDTHFNGTEFEDDGLDHIIEVHERIDGIVTTPEALTVRAGSMLMTGRLGLFLPCAGAAEPTPASREELMAHHPYIVYPDMNVWLDLDEEDPSRFNFLATTPQQPRVAGGAEM